jgi:hypothetical protein
MKITVMDDDGGASAASILVIIRGLGGGVVKFLGMKCPGKKANGIWLMGKTRHDRSAPQPNIPNFLTTSSEAQDLCK